MAGFGLKHLVVAPVTAETATSITYGTGKVAEHARRAAITYNWDDAKLAGDDKTAEQVKILNDADVEIETTELTPDVAVLLGLEKVKSEGATSTPTVYTMVTVNSQPVGVGYIGVDMINGAKVYTAVWIHKVVFSRNNEERTTKEDTINWQTPTISGKAPCVALDNTGEDQIRDYAEFETEAAAITWLNGLGNVQ